ncbi:MAG: ABC transporter permease [bacterium]|nr:ABC transporter permease [bacterium]
MRTARAIARRELAAYFRAPAGWIIIAIFLFLTGLVFALSALTPGQPASLREFFGAAGWLLLPVAPAISMRLLAEEFRSGTIESMLTAPVSGWSLVIGKFMAGMGFLIAMLVPTVVYPIILQLISDPAPDMGPVLAGYVCLILLGGLYIGIGVLASATTSNATLAFLVTFFAILVLLFAGIGGRFVPDQLKPLLFELSVSARIGDFAKGIIDLAHLVYFVAATSVCVVAAAALVELRRWS